MANTWYLGGSPLGLFNIYSRPNADGMSTFNAGKSRNINVLAYNSGRKQQTNIRNSDGGMVESPVSLFSGGQLPNFWGNIGKIGTDQDITGIDSNQTTTYKGLTRTTLHNNDVYDTSTLNIIEKLSGCPSAALRPQDFAYLKYLGVYPNNRLMIARRFGSPMSDNIMTKWGVTPKSILVSWKPDNEDFLSFSFGEEWTDAEADFEGVLNKLGKDFGIDGLGTGADESFNLIPLPGFTEVIRRQLLVKMGVLDGDAITGDPLPSGNPNIIKIAKRRKTIGYGEAGSGLKFKVDIKMVCEYEQKFISGIDPTIAFMDILNNILVFGTSNSDNYGLSTKFKGNIERWSKSPGQLVLDIMKGLQDGFRAIVDEVEKAIKSAVELATEAGESGGDKQDESTPEEDQLGLVQEAGDKLRSEIKSALDKVDKQLSKIVSKYKIELIGIANALSGAPSTPWHITLGNPLRPVFCAGDMITDDLTVTLGSHLAFNDLPVNFRVEFTLTNARPLGLQEILGKFNTGYLRVVNIRKEYAEVVGASEKFEVGNAPYFNIPSNIKPTPSAPNAIGGQSLPTNNTTNPNVISGATSSQSTKEGGISETINNNPNSTLPAAISEGRK